ncbi:MAG TPA: FAD:protein FMN transferase [Steroidobacteraceae bacterium]|nr:FAD:protein FMN transferase [Steroidobacteraceae bacterium]
MAASAGNAPDEALEVEARGEHLLAVRFTAMASPCEVLLSSTDRSAALAMGTLAAREAQRIEKKFSRYRDDSVTAWIHENRGARIEVDEETASLIDFASRCFELSDGLFDITSGVLRRAWKFDGSDRVPEPDSIRSLLPLLGFDKLEWRSPHLMLPSGMELDFGGIGKEYAVDRAYDLLASARAAPFLINFGGDLRANRPPPHGPWQVGIERPDADREATMILDLEHGALATSGDSRRYLLKDGVRYGHILDPRTGWPVPDAPRSVTVAASSCTEAGLLSTLALLQGARGREFLEEQGVRFWLLS